MIGTGVIELGEVRREPLPPAEEPAWSSAHRRWVGVLVGVTTLVVTIGAAAAPTPPLPEATIPAGLGDTAFAEGDRYYIINSDRRVGVDSRTITAYALPDARLLWQAPLALAGAVRGVGRAGGQLLISTQPELLEAVESVAVREETGRVLWRRRALFEGVTPVRTHVLLWTSSDGAPTAGTGREVLEAVDPATAAVRWSYRVPTGGWLSYRYVDNAPTHVVTLLPSGRVEVRDVEDGRVLVAADLLPPRSPAEPASYVQLAGDLLLVRDDRQAVTAYGLQRLDRRWTAEIDLANERVSTACGTTLCVLARTGGVRVLDPATGRVLWSNARWSSPHRAGALLVAFVTDRDDWSGPMVVIDPDTGRQVGELGDWIPISAVDADGRMIGKRTDLGTSRAWLARLDPATGSVRVLRVADDVTGDCDARAGAIICRRLDASVGVWRLAPGG